LERGWLVRTGRGFSLGPAPLVLELLAARHVTWTTIDVEAYSREFGTGAAVAVLVGRHVIYTARSRTLVDERLAFVADQYLPRPPLTTAAGRLLLSYAPPDVRSDVLREARKAAPELVSDYESHLPAIRRQRTAWSDGLSQDGVAAVAIFPGESDREALVLFGRRGRDTRRLKLAAEACARNAQPKHIPSTRL
jgi:DNA-binding IclR family transcriptional regulator